MTYYSGAVVTTEAPLNPEVQSFIVTPSIVDKGGTVFVSWSVTEISTIDLTITYASGSTQSIINLPATGNITLLIDEKCSIKISNVNYPDMTVSKSVLTKLTNMVNLFNETNFVIQSKKDFFENAPLVNKITLQANEIIEKYNIVYLLNGKVSVASNTNLLCAEKILGIATNDANEDDAVKIATSDILIDNDWEWTSGDILYLADDGTITTIAPTSNALLQKIGIALQRNMILVKISEPTILE